MSKLFRKKKERDEFEKAVEKFVDNLVKEYAKINAEMKTNGDCCIHLEGNPSVALLMALSIVDKLKIKLDLDDEDIEELKKATTVIDKEVF